MLNSINLKIIGAATAVFIMAGCGQPEFNPSNKAIVFKDGKPYAVPYGSYYGGPTIGKDRLDALRANGITSCRYDDVLWTSSDFYNKYVGPYLEENRAGFEEAKRNKLNFIEKQDPIFKDNPYKAKFTAQVEALNRRTSNNIDIENALRSMYYPDAYAIKHQKAGCTSQLSSQEYNYYLNKENRNAAQARQSSSSGIDPTTGLMLTNMSLQNSNNMRTMMIMNNMK